MFLTRCKGAISWCFLDKRLSSYKSSFAHIEIDDQYCLIHKRCLKTFDNGTFLGSYCYNFYLYRTYSLTFVCHFCCILYIYTSLFIRIHSSPVMKVVETANSFINNNNIIIINNDNIIIIYFYVYEVSLICS